MVIHIGPLRVPICISALYGDMLFLVPHISSKHTAMVIHIALRVPICISALYGDMLFLVPHISRLISPCSIKYHAACRLFSGGGPLFVQLLQKQFLIKGYLHHLIQPA